MNPYIGHESQISGVEEYRLCGGKGEGLRLIHIYNGQGMELTVSPDRAGDISRLKYKGINMGYFSPCGYVAPTYYDDIGNGWLKSFTAGFLTTCGLSAVGTPCIDNGESLPLHGTIANLPSEHYYWTETELFYEVNLMVRDEIIFGKKLRLYRKIKIYKEQNKFTVEDTIENAGDREVPLEILYHMNMGYPLLDENSVLEIPSCQVVARDEHAKEDIQNWGVITKPEVGYRERCYYHVFKEKNVKVSIFQPKLNTGLTISFDSTELDGFVEWKMMGVRDYVLGLECGNCYPDGRNIMRKKGMLKYIGSGEKKTYSFSITMIDCK